MDAVKFLISYFYVSETFKSDKKKKEIRNIHTRTHHLTDALGVTLGSVPWPTIPEHMDCRSPGLIQQTSATTWATAQMNEFKTA